jgi:WD40 repeat protein
MKLLVDQIAERMSSYNAFVDQDKTLSNLMREYVNLFKAIRDSLVGLNTDIRIQQLGEITGAFSENVLGFRNTLTEYQDMTTQEKPQEKEFGLKKVNEFSNIQYMSKAKFHPQKFFFAVLVGDGTVHLIDAQTGEKMLMLRVPDEMINAFSFLYNGDSMVFGTKSGKLYQADLKTGESAFLKEFGKREIARLDAGRNGNIAVGLGGSIEDSREGSSGFVYSLEAQNILSEYSASFRDDFQGIAISPSGNVVAIHEVQGKARGACLFNASDGSEIKLCYHQQYESGPLSVDVGPDDQTMATGYAPYHVIAWNTEDGSVKWLFEGHSNWVVSLDFSDNGRYLASGAGDSTARVYDLEDGQEIGLVRFPGISTYVKSVDISSDGSLLLTAIDGFVGIYEMPQKK